MLAQPSTSHNKIFRRPERMVWIAGLIVLLVVVSLEGSVRTSLLLQIASSSTATPNTLPSSDAIQSTTQYHAESKTKSEESHVVTGEIPPFVYTPATLEAHVMQHAEAFHLNSPTGKDSGCQWMNHTLYPIPIEGNSSKNNAKAIVDQYLQELAAAQTVEQAFTQNVSDLRKQIAVDGDHRVCDTLELHPKGLGGLFSTDDTTSLSHATSYGFLEPLLPPMRHLAYCTDFRRSLMRTDYILHDFAALCRQLQPTSKIIFVDVGAALDFHGRKPSPVISQIHRFTKMGFAFDHIYGFELEPKDTEAVFRKHLPEDWIPKYHWINLGVSADPEDRLHPFRMLQSFVTPDDLVIVKLDIDTPQVELPLAHQLLSRDHHAFTELVDVFFFEHHVRLKELGNWGRAVQGTIKESMELFQGLRRQGIAAHFWV